MKGFILIVDLANYNAKKLIDFGVGKTIMEGMGKHPENAEVQRYGCYALNHLSYYGPEVQQILVSLGVSKDVVNAMLKFKDNINVQRNGCGTLSQLTELESNIPELLKIPNIEEAIQNAMSVDREYSKLKGSLSLSKMSDVKNYQSASSSLANPYPYFTPSIFSPNIGSVTSTINISGVFGETFLREQCEYLLIIFHHDERGKRTGKPSLYQCKDLDEFRKNLVRNFNNKDYMVYSFDELARRCSFFAFNSQSSISNNCLT